MVNPKKLLGLLLMFLMVASLHSHGGVNTSESKISPPELLQTTDPPGDGLNRTKLAETIAYHRTIDGGYAQSLAEARSTLDLYRYFSAIGPLAQEDNDRFDRYLNERYDSDYGFSYVPRSYSTTSNLGTDYHQSSLSMGILYLEMGNSLSSTVESDLVNQAENILHDENYDLRVKADAAKFLNMTNSLGNLDLNIIEQDLYLLQNNDTTNEFYGAIARYQGASGNYWDYQVQNAMRVLNIVQDLNLVLNQAMNTTSLLEYFDSLQHTFSSNEHDSYAHTGLNYNLTFKSTPSDNENLWNFLNYEEDDWINTFSTYATLKTLDNLGIPVSFNFTGAGDILLYHSYDKYWDWVDSNGDGIADQEPYHRYIGLRYYNQELIASFGSAVDSLGVGSAMDVDLARQELSSFILKTGGVARYYDGATVESTASSLLTLYYLDRDSMSYINEINYTSSLDYMLNLNYTMERGYTSSNGTYIVKNITTIAHSVPYYYHEIERGYTPSLSWNSQIEATRWLLEILDSLDETHRLSGINQTLQNYYIYLVDTDNFNYRTPSSALPLVKGATILGMDNNQLNYTRLTQLVSRQQTLSGGFTDGAYWESSLKFAEDLLDVSGSIFNQSDYLSSIRGDIQTYSHDQGLSWWRGDNWVDFRPTSRMVSYLNESGDLSTLLASGDLNKTKLSLSGDWIGTDTSLYSGVPNYVEDIYQQTVLFQDLSLDQADMFSRSDLNRSETLRWLQDLQYNSTNAPSSDYIGLFARDITDTGSLDGSYDTLRSTFFALKTLEFMGELGTVDLSAAETTIKNLQFTDSNDEWDYGLFADNPSNSYPDIYDSVYGFRALNLLNATPAVTDITSTVEKRLGNDHSSINDWEYRAAISLIGHGGVTSSLFNLTSINTILKNSITNDGFLANSPASARSTYSGFYTLHLINDTSQIDNQGALKFAADLQIDDENDHWDHGGFTSNQFRNHAQLDNTYYALYTLFLADSLSDVNTTSASLFIQQEFENYDNSAKIYTHSVRNTIFPAVQALSTLKDLLYPVAIAPVQVVKGVEVFDLRIEVYDMFFERVANASIDVYWDGTLLAGTLTEPEMGYFEYEYNNTGSFSIGMHTVNITVDHPDLQSYTLSFQVEVINDYLQWIEGVYDVDVPQNEAWEMTGNLYDALGNPVTGAAFSYTVSGPTTSGFSLSTTDNGDGSYALSLSNSNNMTLGTYNVTLTISSPGRTSSTVSYQFEVVSDGGSQATNNDTLPDDNDESQTVSPQIELPGYTAFVSVIGLVGIMVLRRKVTN